jgi:tetratricopeptide (TPR) repeat protein
MVLTKKVNQNYHIPPVKQQGLLAKWGEFLWLLILRIGVCWEKASLDEIKNSTNLLKTYLQERLTPTEQKVSIFLIAFLTTIFYFGFQLLTFSDIDKAIRNHQSAKAQQMINSWMTFLPDNTGLQLRLAHTKISMGEVFEGLSIVKDVQQSNPNDPYLPVVAIDLARNLRVMGESNRALPMLEKVPVSRCKECAEELLQLYTIQGRKELMNRNLQRANFYLSGALKLSEQLKESETTIDHRKRELARAYVLEAEILEKSHEEDKAIRILEESKKIYPIGQTYAMLGKLYLQRAAGSTDAKRSLEALAKAYTYGMANTEQQFAAALNKLKYFLKKEGKTDSEIKDIAKSFSLGEVDPNLQNEAKEVDEPIAAVKPKKIAEEKQIEEAAKEEVKETTETVKVTEKAVEENNKEANFPKTIYTHSTEPNKRAPEMYDSSNKQPSEEAAPN